MIGVEVERILVRILADSTMYDRVMDRVVGRMTQTAARLTGAGRKLTIAVTAPLLAIATMSTMAAGKFEYSAARIQGAANLTDTQLGTMTTSVRSLARELGTRPTGLIESFEELTKGGMELETILAGAGKSAGMLAKVGEVDQGTSAKTLVKILSVFKDENMSAADAANTLSAAADASVISIQDMIHAISQGSSTAAIANQSFGDFSAAIGILGQAGLVSRDAGTSLKTFFLSLVSAERQKFFQKYGLSVKTATGQIKPFRDLIENLGRVLSKLTPAKQLQAVSEMFGTDAARAAIILSRSGTAGFDAMRTKMNGALTVQEKYALLMDTFLGQTERLLGLFENIGIELGESLVPVLRSFADQLENLVAWWEKLNPEQKKAITQTVLYAAALGPALIVTGRMVGMIEKLGLGMMKLGHYGFIPVRRLFQGITKVLASGPLMVAGLQTGVAFGRSLLLGVGVATRSLMVYLRGVAGAMWRVVAIAAAPIVSLFAPITMDIVRLLTWAGGAAARGFAAGFLLLTGWIVPIFAALRLATVTFIATIPAVFAALRVAFISFVAAVPVALGAIRVAMLTLVPWVMALGSALGRLIYMAFAPVLTTMFTAFTTLLGGIFTMLVSGIGVVVGAMATIIALPVLVIGGFILIVEAISKVISATHMMGEAHLTAWEKFEMFAKNVIGWFANLGENWEKFTKWFSENWGNMLSDMSMLMLHFFKNMALNTGVAIAGAVGYFGLLMKESVKWVGEGLLHIGKIILAWMADQFTAVGYWAERVSAKIVDAFNPFGGGTYDAVVAQQKATPSMMSQVGEFNPSAFGKVYNEQKDSLINWMIANTSQPFDGFKSSMTPLPEFNTKSKFVDDLFSGEFLKGLTAMPDLPQAPETPEPPKFPKPAFGLSGSGDFGPSRAFESRAQSPGDTFKEISLSRFAIEGPGGLARPEQKQQDRFVDNDGIKTRLDRIRDAVLASKGIIRR